MKVRLQVVLSVLVSLALLAALAMRVWDLGWIEFKYDEFITIVLANQNLFGGTGLAKVGLVSSIGVLNPPFFIWFMSLPVLLSSNPVVVTAFVVVLNVGGVVLLYVFLKRVTSSWVALWTTSLFASAPWAIIFSRKIWAQDLLLPFLVAYYVVLCSLIQRYRPWKVYLLFGLLGALTQLHMSALFLPVALLIFLLVARVKVRVVDLIVGIGIVVLMYVPYVAYHQQTNFQNILTYLEARNPAAESHLLEHVQWSAKVTSGIGLDYLLGPGGFRALSESYPVAVPLAIFQGYVALVGVAVLLVVARIVRSPRTLLRPSTWSVQRKLVLLLVLTYVVTMVGYHSFRIATYPHYGIIFYPLLPLLVVLAANWLVRRFGRVASAAVQVVLLVVVVANLVVTGSFLHFVSHHPDEIDGDYGVPYALTRETWAVQLQDALAPIRR